MAKHFTFVAKVKPGGGPKIRAMAAERAKVPWADMDKLLRPLTLHYARWLLFDNDTRFIYYAVFDTDQDKYMDDAAVAFGQTDLPTFFSELEGYPAGAKPGSPEMAKAFKKFLAENGVESFAMFEGYPDATVDEIKKALKVRKAFNNMLDEMQ